MKARPFTNLFILCLVLPVFFSTARASVTFTLNPAAVTNDFTGTVTLNITGLTNGQTVRLEKFFDANNNGLIDPGELMVESFPVTDGQVPLIAGVRNSNVPGDDDLTTNGQLTVNLAYPNLGSVSERIGGNYLFRLSDPAAGFAPILRTFTVNQKILPQGVTGRMTSAGSGLPLASAVVVLADQNGNGAVGTATDTNGNYTIYAPPNDYAVVFLAPGFVSDQQAGSVTLASNSFPTVNLTNAVATTTLSGTVSDASTAAGLPGLFIQAENTNNLFTGAFTDASGNFSLPVTADHWKVKLSGESGVLLGYVGQNNSVNANTSGGSVSNLNFQLVKASALVYGAVTDTLTNPVPQMRIDAQDDGNNFSAAGQTDNTGHYSIGVLATSGLNVSPDNSALAAANLIAAGTNVVITNGQALLLNFTVQHITAHLRGQLVDNNSNPISNFQLVVFPFSTNNNNPGPNLNPVTDNNGFFDVGVFGGAWNVDLEINSAASRNLIGPTPVFNVTDGVDITNILIVAQTGTAQISGTVTDNHGVPVVGIHPFGNGTNSGTSYLVGGTTDTNGFYSFQVFPTGWSIGLQDFDLSSRGFQTPANQFVTITGTNNQTVNFVVQPIANTPPTLGQSFYSGGQFQFQLTGLSGRNYRIDASTNFITWTPLVTNTAFGGTIHFADTNSSSFKTRFYRAALLP